MRHDAPSLRAERHADADLLGALRRRCRPAGRRARHRPASAPAVRIRPRASPSCAPGPSSPRPASRAGARRSVRPAVVDWSARWIADAACPSGPVARTASVVGKSPVQLRIRDVDGRRRRDAQAGGIRVPDQPDDLQVRASPPHVRREVLADGVLVGKVPLREHLVDDRHGGTPRRIAIRELPSRQQPNPHRREEAGSRADEVGVVPFRDRLSRGNRGLAPDRSAQRRVGGKAR